MGKGGTVMVMSPEKYGFPYPPDFTPPGYADDTDDERQREEAIHESAYLKGKANGYVQAGAALHDLFETDINHSNVYLQAMSRRCLYAVNGMCDMTCEARPYCLPKAKGLKDV
jgi:hypothetical protein